MKKLPHKKYLTTLIVGRLTNQEILQDLQQQSLGVPPARDVNELRESLKFGQDKYFNDKTILVDLSWIHELGVEAMFGHKFNIQVAESTQGIDGAFKVLNDRAMFRVITTLAMCGVTSEDIELIVNGKYDIEYSSEDLDKFLYYFFDIKNWSYYDKELYLESVKDEQLRTYYRMGLEEEKDYVVWKLGVAPNKSFDAMLHDMVVDCFYNFKEQTQRNQDQANKWGTLFIKVSERLEKVEKDLKAETNFQEDITKFFHQPTKEKEKENKKQKNIYQTPETNISDDREIPNIVRLEELN